MNDLQLNNWEDITKYKIGEDDSIIIFEIPAENSIDLESNKALLLSMFRNVEITIKQNSSVYWIKCLKK